jgi:hypothetical protein
MSSDLVVHLGAKLDEFASDMNHAGDMADSAVAHAAPPHILLSGRLLRV